MTELPKIVLERLRAALPDHAASGRAHPDADLLTAFAEQALSVTERDGVLEHLARCGDCREVVALALPDMGELPAPLAADADGVRATVSRIATSTPRSLGFGWPSLRWVALAAGVAVVVAVLLVRPGKLTQLTSSTTTNQLVATNAKPASSPESTSSEKTASEKTASSEIPSSPIPPSSLEQFAVSAKPDSPPTKSEVSPSKKLKASRTVIPPPAESGMLLADNAQASNAPAIEKAKPASQATGAQATPANELQKTQTAVGASPKSQGRTSTSATQLAHSANLATKRDVAWAITAGVLQRSLDNGQSWQGALHTDHPLQCYASHGAEVWTGGNAGTLFHSADSGATWVQVQASVKGWSLSSDITHIDIGDQSGPAKIVLSTANNEVWSTIDNGKTWEKK